MFYNVAVRILRHPPRDAAAPSALCIGNFDGVHCGHRMLADIVRRRAADENLLSAALTFAPHPLAVLHGNTVRQIGGISDKIYHLSDLNLFYLLRFNRQFAAQTAEEFSALLFSRLRARYVVVGENFRFGKGRRGDIDLLRREGEKYGARVEGVSLLRQNGEIVSSGRIRDYLRDGDFAAAQTLLGRPWTLRGRVVRGRGLGREIGYPTANLNLHFTPVCEGIFVAAARIDGIGDAIPAALSIGKNPTVGETFGKKIGGRVGNCALRVEAFLPDFAGDLYGRRLEICPLHKIRDEQKFAGTDELKQAIAADVAQTREWWRTHGGRGGDSPLLRAFRGGINRESRPFRL